MFICKPRLLRLIASGLLVQTVTQLVWPTVSYALTAGPTAPEATSFEPVDTTDMVNLNTGDLTYSLPLLEVPGPEGGYPLALAYHAGIQPGVEASWVGLGWSLNPGAIARNVNGYADDQQGVSQVAHDYWPGGSTTTVNVGVGVGFAVGYGNAASLSGGLSFSNDTYRGFGLGGYAGAGLSIGGAGSPVGAHIGVQMDGYGNAGAGVSIGVGTQGAVSANASVGLSTNFSSVSANAGAGVSAGGNSLMGASISSSNGSMSLTGPGGSSGVRNDKAGLIQTESSGLTLDIPVAPALFVELGYQYTRYWSDETAVAAVNGALYFPTTTNHLNPNDNTNTVNLDDQGFDTYRVLDPEHEDVVSNPDPEWLMGGSFPDYDNYNVVAQGLSGSMRPYAFQRGLFSRNRRAQNGNYLIKDVPLPFTNKVSGFRFENDFSNTYRQQNGAMNNNNYRGQNYPFDEFTYNLSTGAVHYGNRSENDASGYDATDDRLAGSKHIEWFTNSAIINHQAPGFIDTNSKGFDRQAAVLSNPDLSTQIGGFSITNTSGVTYHFALPAYSMDEYARSEVLDNPSSYSELTKHGKYAYTWYLTAITGPDYIDRNASGTVDSQDWGYWVKFEYGLWSDHYGWRNPAQGYQLDVDANVKRYSQGKKEVYYLNTITTRTHTAIFEKEVRYDAKGSTGAGFNAADTTYPIYDTYISGFDASGKPVFGPHYVLDLLLPDFQ